MNYIVVPGSDGSVQVIETALKLSEPVKIKIKQPIRKPVVVPGELRIASWKIGSISNAA
ncbi:MAG: hypothetical protein ABL866_13320 [Devosia sp.]